MLKAKHAHRVLATNRMVAAIMQQTLVVNGLLLAVAIAAAISNELRPSGYINNGNIFERKNTTDCWGVPEFRNGDQAWQAHSAVKFGTWRSRRLSAAS